MFNTPVQITLFIVGILGAMTTIGCFIPQAIKTIITKDTSGLSKWFFIIAVFSSILWLGIGALNIGNGIYDTNIGWENGLLAGLPPILTNVVTIVTNSIVLVIKLHNIKMSKKFNITEQEYCFQTAEERHVTSKIASSL